MGSILFRSFLGFLVFYFSTITASAGDLSHWPVKNLADREIVREICPRHGANHNQTLEEVAKLGCDQMYGNLIDDIQAGGSMLCLAAAFNHGQRFREIASVRAAYEESKAFGPINLQAKRMIEGYNRDIQKLKQFKIDIIREEGSPMKGVDLGCFHKNFIPEVEAFRDELKGLSSP